MVTALDHVREDGYVTDEVEQACDVRASGTVPYWTHGWPSCLYVFQPTVTAGRSC